MFREYFIYNISKTLDGASGTAYTNIPLTIDKDHDFELKRKIHQATDDRINLKIFDEKKGRYIQKGTVDLRMESGKILTTGMMTNTVGFLPYNEPKPYKFERNSSLRIEASDASGSSNTLRMALHGDKLKEGETPFKYSPKSLQTPIIYETTLLTIAGNTTGQVVLHTDQDGDFLCTKLTGVIVPASGTASGLVTIEDFGRTDERGWQKEPTHIFNLIGNAQFPNNFTSPRYVKRNSTLVVSYQNLTAISVTMLLQFHGMKVF